MKTKPTHLNNENADPAVKPLETIEEETAVENETTPEFDPEIDPAAEPETQPEEPAEPLQHQLLRLQADFENYRKRMLREKQEWITFATEKLVLDLLPVLDNFELGLANSAQTDAPPAFTEGFQLIYNQLLAALEKAGVEPIHAEGEPFDPNLHEAATHLPSGTVPAEHVSNQIRRGYRMGHKLIRPAQVVVSSGPPEA